MNIVFDFFKALDKNAIRYCHWKSIDRMDEVMDGRTDIDLLIDKQQIALFNTILAQFKVISVRPRFWMTYPAMEDYLLYDDKVGKFFHLHLHYKLIMGKKNAKEYILPLDKLYFDNSIKHEKYDTLVIKPEIDLIMLHLRYAVKYTRFQKVYQKIRKFKVSEIKEMNYLNPLCDKDILLDFTKKIDEILNTDQRIFNYFDKEFHLNPLKNISKTIQLKKSISLFKRVSSFEVYTFRKLRKYLNLYAALGRNNAKHPVQSGMTIALVGCDGSGKTTITDTIIKELRSKVSARKYYMGFNARSFSFKTKLLALLSYAPRSAKFIFKGDFGKKINIFGQLIIEYGGYLDRKKLYKQSLRDKANGMIGFYERFPLKNTIDYPQCFYNKKDLDIIQKSKYLTKLKSKLEKKYETFQPADLNFFINTPTKTIRERREMSDKTFEKVCTKYNRVKKYVDNHDWFIDINGNKPLKKVVLDVKNNIFNHLC